MTIIDKSRDFTIMELYNLTKDPAITTLKKHVGESFEVSDYLLREEDDGKRILSLKLPGGEVIASNSPTVQRSFSDILALYQANGIENPLPITLLVYTDTSSKNPDRKFIDIRLVESD